MVVSRRRRWAVMAVLAAVSSWPPPAHAATQEVTPPYFGAGESAYCGARARFCNQSAEADTASGALRAQTFIEADPTTTGLPQGKAKGSAARADMVAAHELPTSSPEVTYDLHFLVNTASVDAGGFADARAYIQVDVYQPNSGSSAERPTWQIYDGGQNAPAVTMEDEEVTVQVRLPNAAAGEVRIVVYVSTNSVLRRGPLLNYLGPGRASAELDVIWTRTTVTY